MYITHAQLNERPGARELSEVATPEHESLVDYDLMEASLTGADTSAWTAPEIVVANEALQRIDAAVVDATSLIDGFLNQRGYLPLDPVPGIVTSWARAIVRYQLHQNRISDEKDPIVRDYKDALKLLQLTADGKFSLGADDAVVNEANDAEIMIESESSVFNRNELNRFR
ncbi:gp436 family protein [Neptuniibacter sp.]|uniref:gp436 family protein n=1 Tax=Neptuniibacter sp. TaxID=1962643 RepID=UPI003B59F7A1